MRRQRPLPGNRRTNSSPLRRKQQRRKAWLNNEWAETRMFWFYTRWGKEGRREGEMWWRSFIASIRMRAPHTTALISQILRNFWEADTHMAPCMGTQNEMQAESSKRINKLLFVCLFVYILIFIHISSLTSLLISTIFVIFKIQLLLKYLLAMSFSFN